MYLFQVITTVAQSCAHSLRSRLRYALRHPHTTLLPRLFVPLRGTRGAFSVCGYGLRYDSTAGVAPVWATVALTFHKVGGVWVAISGGCGLPPPGWPLCE